MRTWRHACLPLATTLHCKVNMQSRGGEAVEGGGGGSAECKPRVHTSYLLWEAYADTTFSLQASSGLRANIREQARSFYFRFSTHASGKTDSKYMLKILQKYFCEANTPSSSQYQSRNTIKHSKIAAFTQSSELTFYERFSTVHGGFNRYFTHFSHIWRQFKYYKILYTHKGLM
jgi:hypothetical protein